MRVISYNLHKGRGTRNGRCILDGVAHALRERAPDLLLCQEVFHPTDDARHQSKLLADLLSLDPHFGPNSFYRRGCHGNATFTRFDVKHAVNISITESFFERRGILHTGLELDGSKLEVLNTHFSLTARQRRRQLRTLLANLPAQPGYPVIVGGDFNDWGQGLDRLIHRRRHFDNALHELPRRDRLTYPARRPVFALDRIYYRGLRLRSIRVLRGTPWDALSDHLPVEAEFELAC